ncbi:MAG TPA: carboxypeptidase regulatory-like domain-containing protein [Bryobacteraceae bacterium]|nr:carboxypeptidase regulatory-like domain-containing protein [Bryobacteraceae bacterium]
MRGVGLICVGVLLAWPSPGAGPVSVTGRVVDENAVTVAGARVEMSSGDAHVSAVCDDTGLFTLHLPSAGEYEVRAEQQGFFVFVGRSISFREGANQLTITMNHLSEFAESVNVVYSPPIIDPQQPDEQKQLNNVEILEVPYPASQDLRSALPMMQGVVQDAAGNLHFNGGATDQTNYALDGFHISDPYTGTLQARISIDSVRSLDLESARYSAEKGRGSAGSLDIKTAMGDDRWRFSGTNFIPGITNQGGWMIDKWTPRLQVSGPLVKSRVWFSNAFDTSYAVNVISGLPQHQNQGRSITSSDLSRFQINVTPANILTGSFLFNYNDEDRHGLSFLDPIETTLNNRANLFVSTLKDQHYFGGDALVEFGFADSRGLVHSSPQGDATFLILPSGHRGNYFEEDARHFNRQQWLSNAFLPPFHWAGTHQLKAGVDLQRSSFDRFVNRHEYEVLRNDLSVTRRVTFTGNRFQARENFEVAQYVQDRWAPREGILIETGLRVEWDEVVRDVLSSPRFSIAYAPKWMGETKLAAGFGVFHDELTLSTLTQNQDQISLSTFFLPNGVVHGPVETAFFMNDHALRVPRYRTASLSVERKLPLGLYGKASYVHKVGSGGFTFVNELEAFGGVPGGGLYQLRNWRHDRYDAAEFTVRRTFGRFEWVAGYTRSRARSDAVVDYSLENPIFAPQGPGPFAWDTPNRFMTWGWAPLPKGAAPAFLQRLIGETDVVYLAEYRTGFPFSVVNEDGILVGSPNARRFPDYFNINLALERKFRFLHDLWAWRFGFNNLTNNGNPNVVNNNIDSPAYLTYGRGQVRAFAVRLRFLGKK